MAARMRGRPIGGSQAKWMDCKNYVKYFKIEEPFGKADVLILL